MDFPSRGAGRRLRPKSVRLANRARPRLEPLECRALLSGQPTSLSAVSGSGIRTGAATLSADLTSGGSALAGQTIAFSLDEDGTITPVGTAMTDTGGVATLAGVSLADFNVGTFAGFVGASYAGNSTYEASGASGTLTVTPQAVDQVALGSSANPSLPGELMTFGVMVIPLSGGPTPTGTIQFQVDGTDFGAAVSLANGSATSGLETSLGMGTHTISAIYSGDSTYSGQTVTMTQTVESPSQVTGRVYTVTSLDDTGNGSGTSGDLRYAITQANANPDSVIDFSVTGTIQLTQALPNINGGMTINGPGPSLLTLNGGGPSSSFSDLSVENDVPATISGLTIMGGNAWDGGGVYDLGTLMLSDCVITGNTAAWQGEGLFIDGPTSLIDCVISNNNCTDAYDGGAIPGVSVSAPVTVTDSVISGNSGGGVTVASGVELTMYGSLVAENYSPGDGGGIYLGGGNGIVLTDCSISGNSASTAAAYSAADSP